MKIIKKNKTKSQLSGKKIRNGERLRFKGVVANLRKDRNGLKNKIKQQTDELKEKNGQLKRGSRKQVRSEAQIHKQREELLHVTRVGKLAEFVSSLAHEISQPLTAILSYAQAAQRMFAGSNPKLQEILQYIINDNFRAAAVIQRLRVLLKKSVPEMKPVNINALVNETIVLIATDAIMNNIILKNELEDDLPLILGDRIQLQQVLLNLISNSIDAMEDSIDPREILIRTSRNDTQMIEVAVKDSGCGIPDKNVPKIFTHFFTSKPDGLGMGLSISRSIVEAHGGKINVKNNPDRGATFYFTVPVHIKDA